MKSETIVTAVITQLNDIRGKIPSDRLVDRDDAIHNGVLGLLNRGAALAIDSASVKPYAFGVAVLSLANARRTAGRYEKALRRYELRKGEGHAVPRQQSPLNELVSKELRERVAQALERLPEAERLEVMKFFFSPGLPKENDPATRAERGRLRARALRRLRLLLADLHSNRARDTRVPTGPVPASRRGTDPACGSALKSFRSGPEAA